MSVKVSVRTEDDYGYLVMNYPNATSWSVTENKILHITAANGRTEAMYNSWIGVRWSDTVVRNSRI